MKQDKKDVKFVKYLSIGMDYTVLAVVIDYVVLQETLNGNKNYVRV